jgi:lipopolysaccharide export system permease protein
VTNYWTSALNRYFSKLFLLWVGGITFIVIFVISLVDLAELSRRTVATGNFSFAEMVHLVCLKIPDHIQLLLPFIILIATLICLSRLNKSQEIIVARGFGLSIWQVASGLSLVVLGISLLSLVIINPLAAMMNYKQDQLERQVLSGNDVAVTICEEGVWIRENTGTRRSVIHAQKVITTQKQFENITFQNFTTDYDFRERVDAKSAFIKNKIWYLRDVTIFPNRQERYHQAELELKTNLSFNKILNSNLEPKYISFWMLPDYIDVLERSGLSSLPYRLHWHSFFGRAGFMITLVFLAAAFAVRPLRQGYTTLLMILGIASGLLLHFFSDVVYALGLARRLPLLVAVWAPAITVMLLSSTLILHLEEG